MSALVRTLLVAALSAPLLIQAQSTPAGASASEVMTKVESDAAAQHKAILLQFGASWCGNCKLFDRFLADPAIHPIMDRAFVFAEMATGEAAGNAKHQNLPGGPELQANLGGKSAGWPYLVMLDDRGKLLASSVRPGKDGNIGYPATADEIAWFVAMLQKAAPSLTPQEVSTIRIWLKTHSPEHA